MSNEMILIISMTLSGIIVFGFNYLNTIIKKRKCDIVYNRFLYLKKLEEEGKIKKEIFSLNCGDEGKIDLQKVLVPRKTRIIINGKKYTDKNSWFIIDNNILWIAGKKENFLIQFEEEILNS